MEQHKHNGMHFELQVHISLFQYTPRSRCCPWKARVLIEADFKVHEQICTVDMRQRSVQQRWGPRMNCWNELRWKLKHRCKIDVYVTPQCRALLVSKSAGTLIQTDSSWSPIPIVAYERQLFSHCLRCHSRNSIWLISSRTFRLLSTHPWFLHPVIWILQNPCRGFIFPCAKFSFTWLLTPACQNLLLVVVFCTWVVYPRTFTYPRSCSSNCPIYLEIQDWSYSHGRRQNGDVHSVVNIFTAKRLQFSCGFASQPLLRFLVTSHMIPPGGWYPPALPLSKPALPGPSSVLALIFLSINIGFFPSLSNCLNKIKGFSSIPKHLSLSPYTI